MGNCGEKTAKELAISRDSQDEYAIGSYKKSAAAWKVFEINLIVSFEVCTHFQNGIMTSEIVPVSVKTKKGENVVDTDEEFLKINFDKIKQLKTVFQKDGTVTAGNASTLNDGAAAVLLASEDAINGHNLTPMARILAFADAATDPLDFALAPPLVVPKVSVYHLIIHKF
ncbi:unnamed protein product [Strongylus vulgaris]|uniref:Thiolase N-terminal domain-containing protein n=1 Tax=Strongylus vulgaris TaxID=40348 RepID=A0A3P7IJ69_STRVU|nr:unnamed protein product [Strongylus vulgaris]